MLKFAAILQTQDSFVPSLLIFATNLMFGGGGFDAPKTLWWNFLPVLQGGYAHRSPDFPSSRMPEVLSKEIRLRFLPA